MSDQIAIVMTEVFLRRLTPALVPFVRRQQDFRIVSIHRPIDELLDLLRELNPRGLITEWLPVVTEAMLKLSLPTVIADTDFSYPGVASIDVDDLAVGAAAAEAFQQAGYRHFACLGNGMPYSGQRIDGFLQAVDSPVSVHTETAFDDARYSEHFVEPSAALRGWLDSLPKPVGIFAVHDPLGRAMSYLSERVQDTINVGQMCDELRIARRSLERKFKEFYRCTPWEMLCRLRVARAKQLLAQTNHPIGMISELCGFNDAERMAVVFKRVTGGAPSSFRKTRLRRDPNPLS